MSGLSGIVDPEKAPLPNCRKVTRKEVLIVESYEGHGTETSIGRVVSYWYDAETLDLILVDDIFGDEPPAHHHRVPVVNLRDER